MLDSVRHYKMLFDSLTVYRGILEDDVIRKLYSLLDYINSSKIGTDEFVKLYSDFYSCLIENNSTNRLDDYFIDKILYSDNIFSRIAQDKDIDDMDLALVKAAENDLNYIGLISRVSAKELKEFVLTNVCKTDFEKRIVTNLPEWNFTGMEHTDCRGKDIRTRLNPTSHWGEGIELIRNFHRENGSGIFAKYTGFIWQGGDSSCKLKGVEALEDVRLSDLTGYENERKEVISNTLQFIKGFKANNVLLYGDRGTGKSSTVKALINEYSFKGLRIIEIPKAYLAEFPQVLEFIKGRKQRFIFFVDDLVFGENEESYTSLKAILEGGLESKPDNAVIYATSNRRHLVVERFSDRTGSRLNSGEDEIRTADTVEEKMSLADRFGITVTFVSPDKKKYLKIVEDIAAKRNLDIDLETLHSEALKWEMRYNGRSPRTARQFVDWLEGQLAAH